MSNSNKRKSGKSSSKSESSKKKSTMPVRRKLGRALLEASTTTSPIRFGSVGENSLIYLKEGVENKISEVQEAIATKEAAKKAALEELLDLEDLETSCTMSDIRQRLNTVVTSLVEFYNAF